MAKFDRVGIIYRGERFEAEIDLAAPRETLAADVARVLGLPHAENYDVRWIGGGSPDGLTSVELIESVQTPAPIGPVTVEATSASPTTPEGHTRIFVSYSHKDAKYLGKGSLLESLRGLEQEGASFWWDRKINAGDAWDTEIRHNLLHADVALVLVSQWFLDSEYIRSVEVRLFLEQMRRNGLIIFPVILSACDWQRHGWLTGLQHLPREGKTLARHYSRSGVREEMWLEIRDELRIRFKGETPAARAIEATSASMNLINALEPMYRAISPTSIEPSGSHSLDFVGEGSRILVKHHGRLIRTITEKDLSQLSAADLDTIITMQKALRIKHDDWLQLNKSQGRPEVSATARSFAAELAPQLAIVIELLQRYGLDLEDHYYRFYELVRRFS